MKMYVFHCWCFTLVLTSLHCHFRLAWSCHSCSATLDLLLVLLFIVVDEWLKNWWMTMNVEIDDCCWIQMNNWWMFWLNDECSCVLTIDADCRRLFVWWIVYYWWRFKRQLSLLQSLVLKNKFRLFQLVCRDLWMFHFRSSLYPECSVSVPSFHF